MDHKQKQSYAPFGSISTKTNRKKKKNIEEAPGPGSYEVSLPIIAPIVQTIKKPNNNVIVKLGHIGTSSFLGANERFRKQENQISVGPGEYEVKSIAKHPSPQAKKERQYAALKIREILKAPIQTCPTITEIKKVAFDDDIQMPNMQQKSLSKDKSKEKLKGVNWSRMSEDRSPLVSRAQQGGLGPGSYQIPALKHKNLSKQPSSSFTSNSVRSFFDQIIFETNQDRKARKRLERQYKSDSVGPGTYDVEVKKPSKFAKYQFFGSTQQRL